MAGAPQPLCGFAKCGYTLGSLTFIDALLCLCALFAMSARRIAAFSYLYLILIARTQHKFDTNSHHTETIPLPIPPGAGSALVTASKPEEFTARRSPFSL